MTDHSVSFLAHKTPLVYKLFCQKSRRHTVVCEIYHRIIGLVGDLENISGIDGVRIVNIALARIKIVRFGRSEFVKHLVTEFSDLYGRIFLIFCDLLGGLVYDLAARVLCNCNRSALIDLYTDLVFFLFVIFFLFDVALDIVCDLLYGNNISDRGLV